MKVEADSRDFLSSSGIYLILNVVSQSFYIGSTSASFASRMSQHLSRLKRGLHENFLMQRSWDKHGADAFVFRVLEVIDGDLDLIFGVEQIWLDATFGNRARLNLSPNAGSPEGTSWPQEKKDRHSKSRTQAVGVRFIAIAPDGTVHEVQGLRSFARDHGLERSSIVKVLKGKWHSYKGWLFVPDGEIEPLKQKRWSQIKWIAVSPSGEEFEIANLNKFARDNGLTDSCLHDLARGRLSQHKGWKCYFADGSSPAYVDGHEGRRKEYIAIAPDGAEHFTDNLPSFCREHNLVDTKMRDCAKGVSLSHKGWRCCYPGAPVPELDRTAKLRKSYILTTPEGIEFESSNLPQVCKDYGLGLPGQIGLGNVARGKISNHKGWLCKFADGSSPKFKNGNDKKRKSYIITSPGGTVFHVDNLPGFCKEHGLGRSGELGLAKVARGQQKTPYKGWMCQFRQPVGSEP